jgi:predicted Zn-dependent protease
MSSALNTFNAEIEKDRDNAQAYFGRAVVLSQMNRIDDALADVNQLLRLRPTDAVVFVLRGELLYSRGEIELALADLNKAVSLAPKSPAVYLHRAHFYVASEDWKQAERDYTAAIRQDANCWVAYEYRSGVRSILGNKRGAEADMAVSKCLRSAATGEQDLPGTGACESVLTA